MADEDIFEKARQRIERLNAQFAKTPLIELVGLVGPSGPGGASQDDGLWTLLISLEAWRVGPGPAKIEAVTVCKSVKQEEIKKYQELIKVGSIIRIRCRLLQESELGLPQAQLEEVLETGVADQELQQCLEELSKPVTHHDDRFGTLVFDRRLGWYSCQTPWRKEKIELTLNVEHPDDLDVVLESAHRLWEEQSKWWKQILNYAVEELLNLKNDTWLEEGERKYTARKFVKKMTLESVSVCSDGSFEFWFDDGDLFWGHSIMVSGDLSSGLNDAGIHG